MEHKSEIKDFHSEDHMYITIEDINNCRVVPSQFNSLLINLVWYNTHLHY